MVQIMNIKLLILDVDGTLTDGKIYMSDTGEAFKAFSIKDGYIIKHILPKYGITPVVITGRYSKIVENRCKEIDILHCYQNCTNKIEKLKEVADSFGLSSDGKKRYKEIAYIGDDLNDLEAMSLCSFVGCPCNACKEVKAASDYVSPYEGGHGAVRDILEYMAEQKMF